MVGKIISCALFFRYSINHIRYSLCKSSIRTIRSHANVISCDDTVASVDGVTVPELLRSNLHKWEKEKAFDCASTGITYTHGEIFKKSRSFSAALKQSGLKRNDVVGIVLPNVPEYPIVYVGIWDAGLIASPTSPNYLAEEIIKQMSSCEAKAIVTVPELIECAKQVKNSCPKLKSIIVIGEAQKDCHSFYEMLKVNSTGTELLKGSQITNDDIALLPYSSGTTGPPKGVMLTHKNVAINILQMSSPDFHHPHVNEGGDTQERLVAVLPFYHIYGCSIILGVTLFQGHFLACVPKFNPKSFVETLRKHKPTSLHLAPPLIAFMNQSSEIGRKETECIKAVMNSSAPAGITLIQKFLEKFGTHIFFQEGYGMTELSPASHMSRRSLKNCKLGSCGSVLPGTLTKIACIDTGKALGPNEEGEICVLGPQVMKGYYNNEKATKEIIDSEGWLHTGDVGYYDKDECFFIVDRIKELIKVKGLQVGPAELEDIFRKHPGVADVAVIGVPHELAGEAPRAYIVKKEGQSVSESELKEYLNKRVAKYKQLVGGLEFLDIIPKTASGKILRKELKAEYLKRKK